MKIKLRKIKTTALLITALIFFGFGCSSDSANTAKESTKTEKPAEEEAVGEHGVGPVEDVDLSGEIVEAMVAEGKTLFESKCSACHKFGERYVGPDLADVVERRNPAWIMNMIMVPEKMTQKDPIAKALLAEYMTQMVNQNVSEDDARAILEYLRTVEAN